MYSDYFVDQDIFCDHDHDDDHDHDGDQDEYRWFGTCKHPLSHLSTTFSSDRRDIVQKLNWKKKEIISFMQNRAWITILISKWKADMPKGKTYCEYPQKVAYYVFFILFQTIKALCGKDNSKILHRVNSPQVLTMFSYSLPAFCGRRICYKYKINKEKYSKNQTRWQEKIHSDCETFIC